MTNSLITFNSLTLLLIATLLCSCNDDDPQREDTPELITKVTLTFTPDAGTSFVATASDPDGAGVQNVSADGPIDLEANTTYTLTISLINELANPSDPAYNITEEVAREGDEHMLFFEWTDDLFSDPVGNGNTDDRNDDVNYEDQDENSLPVGLETRWTAAGPSSGAFRIVLKHQPGLKTETSGVSSGETDLDLTFGININ